MSSSIVRRCGAALTLLHLLLLAATAYAQVDRKDVVRRAHGSYYSLKQRGLSSFQCDLSPNWESLLQDVRKTDPQGADRAVAKLSQLRFTVSMGISGSAKVTHTTVTPDNAEMAKGLDEVYNGMEQMVSGFFDTWAPFMITAPFPEVDSDYALADHDNLWALTYKEGAADVQTTMGKDLVIRELKVNSPQFSSSLRPQFTRGPQGLMLSAYQADYVGQSSSETTKLNVGISYQVVSGFQLPQKLDLGGSYGGTPFQVQVTFSGCQAKGQ